MVVVEACTVCQRTAELCGVSKLQKCGGCSFNRYCSKACQKADWPSHKAVCSSNAANSCAATGKALRRWLTNPDKGTLILDTCVAFLMHEGVKQLGTHAVVMLIAEGADLVAGKFEEVFDSLALIPLADLDDVDVSDIDRKTTVVVVLRYAKPGRVAIVLPMPLVGDGVAPTPAAAAYELACHMRFVAGQPRPAWWGKPYSTVNGNL